MYDKLSEREEYLAIQIVDIAIKIHRALGPGLLESVYEKCFEYELIERYQLSKTKRSTHNLRIIKS